MFESQFQPTYSVLHNVFKYRYFFNSNFLISPGTEAVVEAVVASAAAVEECTTTLEAAVGVGATLTGGITEGEAAVEDEMETDTATVSPNPLKIG